PFTVATLSTTASNGDLGLTGTVNGASSPAPFRTNSFPQAAVNPITGNLYVTWNSRGTGFPADKADVFFAQGSPAGNSRGAPAKVNDDSTLTDQWQPSVAVTGDGSRVGFFYYSRQVDLANNQFRYFGRIATVSGTTLTFAPGSAVSDTTSLPEFDRDI